MNSPFEEIPHPWAKILSHNLYVTIFLSSAALSSLRDLSKATSILSDPSKVPEQALRATASRDPTDLSAMMAPAGADGGPRNTGASGGFN